MGYGLYATNSDITREINRCLAELNDSVRCAKDAIESMNTIGGIVGHSVPISRPVMERRDNILTDIALAYKDLNDSGKKELRAIAREMTLDEKYGYSDVIKWHKEQEEKTEARRQKIAERKKKKARNKDKEDNKTCIEKVEGNNVVILEVRACQKA